MLEVLWTSQKWKDYHDMLDTRDANLATCVQLWGEYEGSDPEVMTLAEQVIDGSHWLVQEADKRVPTEGVSPELRQLAKVKAQQVQDFKTALETAIAKQKEENKENNT